MPKKKIATNKGPKGKKARQAAKLERQWGEEADEEEISKAKIRKGKRRLKASDSESRVKSKISRPNNNGRSNYNSYHQDESSEEDIDENASTDDDDDSIDGNYDENEKQFALSSLLQNIGKKGQQKNKFSQRKTIQDDNNDDESLDYSSSSESDDTASQSNNDMDDDDDAKNNMGEIENSNNNHEHEIKYANPIGENPFQKHFGKEALPEDDASPSPESMVLHKTDTKTLNSNFVLQMSKDIMESVEVNDRCDDNDAFRQSSLKSFSHVHQLIKSKWDNTNERVLMRNIGSSDIKEKKAQVFTPLQSVIYSSMAKYADVLITCANRKNRDAINNLISLHIVNHVLKANGMITMHNGRIRDIKAKDEEENIDQEEEWRDQGYTRPKILILLPTRSTAYTLVNEMLKVMGENNSIENLDRFNGEFGDLEVGDDSEKEKRRKNILNAKGQEWNELFSDDKNADDDFKIGISLSNKKKDKKAKRKENQGLAVKLFSDFYYSDFIIASPLGLKMAITKDDEVEDDSDFLSSIEIVLSLQSDVMLMQNWDHVMSIMERINQQPKKTDRTDFSRVRNYLLCGQAARWRQFIMVSRFSDPHLLSTFNNYSKSIAGIVKLRRKVPADEASICNVIVKMRQVFQRVPCESISTQGESRIKYFKEAILPQIMRTKQKHTLIYVPSYFDFVSLRNMLLKHDIASSHFVSVTEYSRGTEVTRGRARFLQGRKRIMLYTGRAHFFMRHHIKGARHLIMFGLPEHAEFYPELSNMLSWRPNEEDVADGEELMDISAPASCLNLFTRYDAHSLERIVGTKHSNRMVKGDKRTFLFNS